MPSRWVKSEADPNRSEASNEVDQASPPQDTAVPPQSDARRPSSSDDREKPADSGWGSDIVKLVKPRSDWWDEGPLASPVKGVAADSGSSLDKLIFSIPIPAYGFLGITAVIAIAFVGSIFQLFYDNPPAPVLGVPTTSVVLALSGPTWILTFIAAIKKGQAEADAEDDLPY